MAISILLCSIIAITSFAANSSQGDNEAEIEELQPVMASRCSYPLVSGYYGRPDESGGSMRVMDGGIENAESFFTFLTGQVAVYNTTVSIPGGGTARITSSNTQVPVLLFRLLPEVISRLNLREYILIKEY